VIIPSYSTINEKTHQSQQINEVKGSLDHASPSHSIPPPTSYPHITSRIHDTIAKDHLVDQIVSDITKVVQTRSRIASFCEHYSFVSCIEPNRVEEALQDID
jgi:hypothetical protein